MTELWRYFGIVGSFKPNLQLNTQEHHSFSVKITYDGLNVYLKHLFHLLNDPVPKVEQFIDIKVRWLCKLSNKETSLYLISINIHQFSIPTNTFLNSFPYLWSFSNQERWYHVFTFLLKKSIATIVSAQLWGWLTVTSNKRSVLPNLQVENVPVIPPH